MENEKFNPKNYVKAPHYFLVHLKERFTSVSGTQTSGKPYPMMCDGIAVNVYGFKSQEETNAFDPITLRTYLIGGRSKTRLFGGKTRELATHDIFDFLNSQKGAMQIDEKVSEPMEDLPTCERMHVNTKTGELFCGKPENQYHDGSCGGCVLDGNDQEFDPDHIICPMQEYWNKRFEEKKKTA